MESGSSGSSNADDDDASSSASEGACPALGAPGAPGVMEAEFERYNPGRLTTGSPANHPMNGKENDLGKNLHHYGTHVNLRGWWAFGIVVL